MFWFSIFIHIESQLYYDFMCWILQLLEKKLHHGVDQKKK